MTRDEQLEQAEYAGRCARENGRGMETCPGYGIDDEDAPELRRRWRLGWVLKDNQIKKARKA